MIIFLDEAGPFSNPDGRANSISCVGALVIPETSIDRVYSSFRTLKFEWGVGEKEIKGSELNEKQVSQVIEMLSSEDVVLKVVGTDLGLTNDTEISAHKSGQAEKILKSADGAKNAFAGQLIQLAERTLRLSNPLYVQYQILTCLIDEILRTTTLYYCQRTPELLGSFIWVFDAKDKTLTTHEELWSQLCRPYLQTISLRRPLDRLEGADYSHFNKFCKSLPEPPKYLAEHVQHEQGDPFNIIELDEIMRSLQFCDSKAHLGLQLVDILVTTVRRSLRGTLQQVGWGKLGKLMVQAEKGSRVISLLSFGKGGVFTVPYAKVIDIFEAHCKSMVPR